jgi:CheY-like chemotaxis protein
MMQKLNGHVGPTVLVVDDEEEILAIAASFIHDLGYNAAMASNGEEALAALQRDPGIDVLFTDVVMPRMDGYELAHRALQLRPGLKVLFTTGFAGQAQLDRYPFARAAIVLRKPYRLVQLEQALQNVLNRGADGPP